MTICGQRLDTYGCESDGAWYRTALCRHRLCPWCARVRAWELQRRYRPHLTTWRDRSGRQRATMITLTQHTHEGESVSDAWARLRAGHRHLVAQLRHAMPGIGGLTSLEATPREGRTWHAHAHVLLRPPQQIGRAHV